MTNSSNASAASRSISEDAGHAEATSSTGQSPGRPRTDLGNAARLIDWHGDDLRFVSNGRFWAVRDGDEWKRDDTGEIVRRAVSTIYRMHALARALGDTEAADWAFRSESVTRVYAMVRLARRDSRVVVESL